MLLQEIGNQQLSSEQEKAQRLFLVREVQYKRIGSGFALTHYGEGQDIVCALLKDKEVHKRTAYNVAIISERHL